MIMGQSVVRQILSETESNLWFAIIADEATDISYKEQLSISVRWVDNDCGIHENTIGLIQHPTTKAQTIFSRPL